MAVDTYRGLLLLLLLANAMQVPSVAAHFPDSRLWQVIGWNMGHSQWVGLSLVDMSQPGFAFLVGTSLYFSIASRRARGERFAHLLGHAVRRAVVLVALGIFLRSLGGPRTNWTFIDTLSQIGLGYVPLFFLALARPRWQWGTIGAILLGYWALFAFYPAPGTGYNWARVMVPNGWQHHLAGFASHWDINSNAGAAFDRWFLNLFPRQEVFRGNSGGYVQLNFIPTLATMVFGLVAGRWIRERSDAGALRRFVVTAALCLAAGLLLHVTGICPVVKRLWTPSFTLVSAAVCFAMLAALTWIHEVRGWTRWAFPAVVVGTNSLTAYLMNQLTTPFLADQLRIHLPTAVLNLFGSTLAPLLVGALVVAIEWYILLWMYRRRIYVKL